MDEVTTNAFQEKINPIDGGLIQNMNSSILDKNMPHPDLTNPENIKPNKKYVCFAEAHKFAKSLNLKTRKEWRLYVKGGLSGKEEKPANIPAHPDGIYKVKGWQGWKYWLGTADKGVINPSSH